MAFVTLNSAQTVGVIVRLERESFQVLNMFGKVLFFCYFASKFIFFSWGVTCRESYWLRWSPVSFHEQVSMYYSHFKPDSNDL